MKKQALQHYLSTLKRSGFIKKVGYGVWEILKEYSQKEVQTTTRVTPDKIGGHLYLFKTDNVRAHAFQFTIKLPALRNWEKRAEILRAHNIGFKDLKILGGGQKLAFRGRKVWLTNKSIIIYERASYLAETAAEAKKHAIYDLMGVLKGLENLLGANFAIKGQYLFRVSRQHYSLVKNALAQQYDREGKKMQVYNASGLWFVIDNSFNLHEAETIHPKTAEQDNKKVQDWFNGIKQYEGFTPQFVVSSIGEVTANQQLYAKNIQSHIQAIQDLGTGVKQLASLVAELKHNPHVAGSSHSPASHANSADAQEMKK